MPVKDNSIYERSLLRMAATESKLKQLECSMMQSCTFTPNTSKSKVSPKTPNANDSGQPRLKKSTPKRFSILPQKSPSSRAQSTGLGRVEELYRDGVRKNKQRVMTAKEEEDAREQRIQERELAACTFQPQLDWKMKKDSPNPVKGAPHLPVMTSQCIQGGKHPIKEVGGLRSVELMMSPLQYPDVESVRENGHINMSDMDVDMEAGEE